jgi:hypothetical protein
MTKVVPQTRLRVATLVAAVSIAVWMVAGPAGASWLSTASGQGTARADAIQAPSGLSATCNLLLDKSVNLAWSPAKPWSSYEVRWGTSNGGPYGSSSATLTGTTYTTPTLPGSLFGTTYYFVVRAIKGSWVSANSNQVSKTISTLACS